MKGQLLAFTCDPGFICSNNSNNPYAVKNQYKSNLYCILIFLLLGPAVFGQGKQLSPDNLQISFLRDSMLVVSNRFEFNSCAIAYAGRMDYNLEVSVEAPAGITIVSGKTTLVQLSSGQQQVLTIRLIQQQGQKPEWTPVVVRFLVRETGQAFSRQFYIRQKEDTKWRAGLQVPEMLVRQQAEESEVTLWVENLGNVGGEYRVHARHASVKGSNDKTLWLEPGERKSASFNISLARLRVDGNGHMEVPLVVRSKNGEEKIFLQQLKTVGNVFQQHYEPYKKLPLALELSWQQTGSFEPILSGALQGLVPMGPNRELEINSRWFNIMQAQKRNHLGYLEYRSKNWELKAGTIIEFDHFLTNGTGLEFTRKRAGGEVSIGANRSNFGNVHQVKFNWDERLSENAKLLSSVLTNIDKDQDITSVLNVNTLRWQLGKRTAAALMAGSSYELVNTFKDGREFFGSAVGYQFETATGPFQWQSKMDIYSKAFPGFNKGFSFHQHEVKWQAGKNTLGVFVQANKKLYTDTRDSLFTNLMNINNREAGLRWSYGSPRLQTQVSVGYARQQQDSASSLLVSSWKGTASMLLKLGQFVSFSALSNVSLLQVAARPDVGSILASNNYGSLQVKNAGVYFQYNAGPFYYFETMAYLQSPGAYERVQLAPYVEKNFGNTQARLQYVYTRELPMNFSNTAINGQVQIPINSLKTNLALNTSYSLNNPASSFALVSVRKQLNLPVIRAEVSNKFDAYLFRDHNSNNVFDDGDEPVAFSRVLINGQYIESDAKGELGFRNVGDGKLTLDFSNSGEVGWIPTHGIMQSLVPVKGEKRIAIPFKKSRVVTGRLLLEALPSNVGVFDPAGVRITATGSDGISFSTLTNGDGEFRFNLPADKYIISYTPAVLPDRYLAISSSEEVDLVVNESVTLTFKIVQQKRQINIRRADQ